MLLGDSLTQQGSNPEGWAMLLQQTYVRSVDVINRGLSGYNTKNYKEVALSTVSYEVSTVYKPALVVVWLGANDMALANGPSAKQHVSVDQYRDNLILMLSQFRQLLPTVKLLLITPHVVVEEMLYTSQSSSSHADDLPSRTNAVVAIYAAACHNVTQAVEGVELLDLHQELMDAYPTANDRRTILGDGLHFNTLGNHVVFDKIRQQIEQLLPTSLLTTPQFPFL